MDDETSKRLDSMEADLALLRILALALFEQSPARNLVLDQFSKDAESHTVDSLKSPMPESFVAAFEDTRTVYLALLADSLAAKGQ
jgi:hypothetical protein